MYKVTNKKVSQKLNEITMKAKSKILTIMLLVLTGSVSAQNGALSTGMASIKTQADNISTTGQQICYAIAVIIGIVGAVRILGKQSGERENLHKEIAGWFGATLFFAAAGVMIRALMGA
jgi:Domain of unknown function (DUF4134)